MSRQQSSFNTESVRSSALRRGVKDVQQKGWDETRGFGIRNLLELVKCLTLVERSH